jgi:hypothetical protein
MMGYQKFCYWMDLHTLEKVKADLNGKEIQISDEVYIPCRVLRKSMEIGCVRPSAWEGFCKRRTSWYLNSEKAGKFLVVSNQSLGPLGLGNPILITESNFKPDRLPTSEEITELIESVSFQRRKPRLWDKIEPVERDFQKRWVERHGINEPFDFDKTFMIHSANHSNFITPRFYMNLNGAKVPYSVSDSAHVCSSCIEFFNILGEQWPVKYAVPCIGAVQFAHLLKDQYFEVKIGNTRMDHKRSADLETSPT